jgi:fructokinase
MSRLLSVGELLWDLLPSGPVLGGAPANLAFRAASLGLSTSFASRVGADDLGRRALDELRALGLATDLVQLDPLHATGTVPVTFRPDGTHEFTILPDVAYDYLEAPSELLAAARAADAFCFGTLCQRSAVSRATLTRLLDVTAARLVVCDVNLRRDCYSEASLRFSLARANVLKLNEAEVAELASLLPRPTRSVEEFCAGALEAWSLETVVVTRGADGAYARDAHGASVSLPGYRVPIVDTIGSGDAFTAAFVAALLAGRALDEATRRGNALGALVASRRGPTEPIPAGAIEGLLAAH